jgi:hypothetical protein
MLKCSYQISLEAFDNVGKLSKIDKPDHTSLIYHKAGIWFFRNFGPITEIPGESPSGKLCDEVFMGSVRLARRAQGFALKHVVDESQGIV